MQIFRELWSVEETDEHARLTYQYVIDLRERLEKTCKLAQDNDRKLDPGGPSNRQKSSGPNQLK